MIKSLTEVCEKIERTFKGYEFSSRHLILELYINGPTRHISRRNMTDNFRAQLYFKSIFEEYMETLYGTDMGFKINTDRYKSIPTITTKGMDGTFYTGDFVSIVRILTKKFGAVNIEVSS